MPRALASSSARAAALLATAAALAGCARAAPEDALARVRRAGVLRWGADEQGGEPYAYEDPARPGHFIGFEVELADALARALGVRAERVQNDWSTLVPSLTSQNIRDRAAVAGAAGFGGGLAGFGDC